MTNEQQRIAIAEASGWVREYSDIPTWDTSLNSYKPVHTMLFRRQEKCFRAENLPDYLNDLNAMHDAEKMLEVEDNHAYGCYCIELYEKYGNTVSLAAAQRAEAFLRTIGK